MSAKFRRFLVFLKNGNGTRIVRTCPFVRFRTRASVTCHSAKVIRPAEKGEFAWGRYFAWWTEAQFALMCSMALAVLLHLMLHWSWVCGVVALRVAKDKKAKLDDGIRTLYGVGLLIVVLHVLAIALAAAYFTVQPPVL